MNTMNLLNTNSRSKKNQKPKDGIKMKRKRLKVARLSRAINRGQKRGTKKKGQK